MEYMQNIGDKVLEQALLKIQELPELAQQNIRAKLESPLFKNYIATLNSQSEKVNYMYSYGDLEDVNKFINRLSKKFIEIDNVELIKQETDIEISATSKITDYIREGDKAIEELGKVLTGESDISNDYIQKLTNIVDVGGIENSIAQFGDIKKALDEGEQGIAADLIAKNILTDTDLIVSGVKEFKDIANNIEKSLSSMGLSLTPEQAQKHVEKMSNQFIESTVKEFGDKGMEALEGGVETGFNLLKEKIKDSFSPELMEKFDRLQQYTDALGLKKVKISYLMNVAARENSLSFEDFAEVFIEAAPRFNEKILDIAQLVGEEAVTDGPDKDSERKIKSIKATVDTLKVVGTTILVIANIMKIVLLTMKIIKIVAIVLKQLGLAKEIGACIFNPANIPALAGKIAKEIINYLTNYLEDFLKKIPEFLLSIKVPVPEVMVELMLMNTRKGATPTNQDLIDAFDVKKVQEEFNSNKLINQLEKDKEWNNDARPDIKVDWSQMESVKEIEDKMSEG